MGSFFPLVSSSLLPQVHYAGPEKKRASLYCGPVSGLRYSTAISGHAAHTVMLASLCPGMSILRIMALCPIPFLPLWRVFARLNAASTTGMSLYMFSLPSFHLQ